MPEFKTYRSTEIIRAYRVEGESVRIPTVLGVMEARDGDYVALVEGGEQILSPDWFEANYSELRGDNEFHPDGKTVEQVVEFMKLNPDQVPRIIAEENAGAGRKGITGYAG
jgi:hypothetical protein